MSSQGALPVPSAETLVMVVAAEIAARLRSGLAATERCAVAVGPGPLATAVRERLASHYADVVAWDSVDFVAAGEPVALTLIETDGGLQLESDGTGISWRVAASPGD